MASKLPLQETNGQHGYYNSNVVESMILNKEDTYSIKERKSSKESAIDSEHGRVYSGMTSDNPSAMNFEGQLKGKEQDGDQSRIMRFTRKYFLEGQKLMDSANPVIKHTLPFWKRVVTSRRFWGIIIPLIFFEVCWWSLAIKHNFFKYFPDKYVMSITMIFGAMVAGMTSEGGGAVAFPVMTLALHISPSVARDFSLMIQSCGMSAAAFTIFWMKLKVEKHSLLFCSLGMLITI